MSIDTHFVFLKTSRDALDLKLNVKWKLSNIHTSGNTNYVWIIAKKRQDSLCYIREHCDQHKANGLTFMPVPWNKRFFLLFFFFFFMDHCLDPLGPSSFVGTGSFRGTFFFWHQNIGLLSIAGRLMKVPTSWGEGGIWNKKKIIWKLTKLSRGGLLT